MKIKHINDQVVSFLGGLLVSLVIIYIFYNDVKIVGNYNLYAFISVFCIVIFKDKFIRMGE